MSLVAEKKKRCLYEVLGVSRDCSQDEIRSAYRKLALQLHPDKLAAQNGGAVPEDATAAFQELLHAYEVLSDPKERSYYDSHRTQILFSDLNSSNSRKPFSSFFDIDIFSFFSPSAFSGYSDTGLGFFKVYGDVFSKVYEQELWFAKELGLDPDAVQPAPLIGNIESHYSQVTAFYNYWMSFCTVMDFGWVEEYDAAAGENRKSRRLMEEENKKLRKKAKREYNDSMRGLAAFVKKRDKRVIDMVKKRNAEEEKRRVEERERKKEEERRKLERARMYEEPDWAKLEEEEELLKDDSFWRADGAVKNGKKKKGSGGGEKEEELFCVVCSKKFKSEKQWKNHEQSKKHRVKVAELRNSMLDEEEEEATVSGDDVDVQKEPHVSFDYVPDADNSDLLDELCEELESNIEFQEENDEVVSMQADEQELSHVEEESVLKAMVSGHKNINPVNFDQPDSSSSKAFHDDCEDESFMEYDTQKKGCKNRRRKGAKGKGDEEDIRKETSERLQNESGSWHQEDNGNDMNGSSSNPVEEDGTIKAEDNISRKNQKLKGQQIGRTGTGKKDSNPVSKSTSKGKKHKGSSKASNACQACGENFDTRNKLFMHLGETGHAVLKSR